MGAIYSIKLTVYGNVVEREALVAEFEKDYNKQNVSCFVDGHVSIVNFEAVFEPNQEWLNDIKQKYPTFSHINVLWFSESRYLSPEEKNLFLITATGKALESIELEIKHVKDLFKINATNEELRSIANEM